MNVSANSIWIAYRAGMFDLTQYPCALLAGTPLECDAVPDDGISCSVKGRTVLYAMQGTSRTDSGWQAFGTLR